MPSWKDVVQDLASSLDRSRMDAINKLASLTDRNTIVYYSGWMQKPEAAGDAIILNDADINGFMACIRGLDKSKGLDLVLHTPGGVISATQAIVSYLRSIFGINIRAIIPQLAMSAGTMLACSCKEVWMGKHSSIGPFDPRFGSLSTYAVIGEFEQAKREIVANPLTSHAWRPILEKYRPGLIIECGQAIELAHELVKDWLKTGMFKGHRDKARLAKKIVDQLGNAQKMKQHDRHVSAEHAKQLGLVIKDIENDNALQDAVLTIHHLSLYTLSVTPLVKLIESSARESYNTFARPRA